MENNNQKVLTRMARRSLTGNRQKNLILILAIALSTFMLFTILTVGQTYFTMQRVQEIRLKGADFDAYLYGGFTERQEAIAKRNPQIKTVGIEGLAGWAEKTEADDTLHTVLLWADEAQWGELMEPAVKRVQGSYPQNNYEVLASKSALKDCGLEHLGIGDTFTMTYADKLGSHTGEFTISGLWEGYGEKEVLYVSRSFFEQSGYRLSDYGRGFLYLKFKNSLATQDFQDSLLAGLELGRRQRLLFTSDSAQSVEILIGMAGLILITCLSAYLLIYNILYLSVSGNIRYYGLLQTIGMTGRQVKRLMRRQMLLAGGLGMAAGLLLGTAASFFLIPGIVKTLGIREADVHIAFCPQVFLFSLLIIFLTIWLGSRKPVKIATSVSPMEALGYRVHAHRKRRQKTRRTDPVWRMAIEQFTKDKKKTLVVVLSLAASLSVFLCLITLIESQGARTLVSNYMDYDMVIENDTLKKEEQSQWEQILGTDFLQEIGDMEGVKEIHPILKAKIIIPWEPDFADLWIRKFYDMWMDQSYEEGVKEYKQHPEKFYSFITGIDEKSFDDLNRTLETPVDKQAFLEGESCILYRHELELDMGQLQGKSVTCSLDGQKDQPYRFAIAGLTDESYFSGILGMTPTIIVSDTFLKGIAKEPYVFKVGITYRQEYDEGTEEAIRNLMDDSPYAKKFSDDSKVEEKKIVEKAQGNMMGIGIGITVVLAMIGMMNYINTVTGNIQRRQIELAILESVGMTDRQMSRMLVREGLLFAGSSLLLTGTVGTAVTYLLYQSMNYRGIPFAIPLLPILGMVIFILAICTAIPLVSYRLIAEKKSIVERIRGFE